SELAEFRYAVASIAMFAIFVCKRRTAPKAQDLPRLLLSGFIGIGIYNLALNTGELTVNAGSASFVGNTVPIFTALFARLVLAERLNALAFVGFVVSFAGATLLAFSRGSFSLNTGILFVLLAAVSQAVYFVI